MQYRGSSCKNFDLMMEVSGQRMLLRVVRSKFMRSLGRILTEEERGFYDEVSFNVIRLIL